MDRVEEESNQKDTMTKVQNSIDQSIMQNRIVTIEATEAELDALKLAADDWVENGPVIEFWGVDDDGDTWRVHVEVEGER